MKKVLYISLISILVAACHGNTQPVAIGNNNMCLKLSPWLEEAFTYFIEHEKKPDTSTVYLMEFTLGEPGFPLNDTLIYFCEYYKNHLTDGFMGIITIGDYKVCVFDKQNVGSKFYAADSLMDMDLNRLCLSPPEDLINCCAFILDGDTYLYLLGCQPDDFVPIKIERE